MSQIAFGLCNLVCMVWKNIIYSATVNIHILPQMFDSDAGALNMPSRITDAPWAIPFQCLVFKFGFGEPEHEVCLVFLIRILIDIIPYTD